MLDNNIVERLLESIDTSETRYVMHEMYSKDKSISFFCLFKPIDFATTILFFFLEIVAESIRLLRRVPHSRYVTQAVTASAAINRAQSIVYRSEVHED